MSPRTPTHPPNDARMWRRLVAATHPDAGGDHDLFVWAMATREVVCGGDLRAEIPRHPGPAEPTDPERVPFDPFADFALLTDRALFMADAVAAPYGYLLRQLADCVPAYEGSLYAQQARGASYRRLAAIGHSVGMDSAERAQWYDVCRSIPLSDRHAAHILGKLKRRAA